MINTLDGLHGAYTYRFAREAWGEQRLRCAVEAGELIGFGRGVLLDAERVLDLRTRCAGALLLTDGIGVIVGLTAAALHGCTAVGGFPIHVRMPYSYRYRNRPGLVIHQGLVAPTDVHTMDGIRVLPLDLAVAEVLCTAARRAGLACADQAMRDMDADDRLEFLARVTDRLFDRADRRGTKRAAAILSLASGKPETAMQSALVLAFGDCGIPAPACQYEVAGPRGLIRHRLDFGWPDERVAVECQDEASTGDPTEDLTSNGWLIIKADTQDLVDPTKLCTNLRTALSSRKKAQTPNGRPAPAADSPKSSGSISA